MNTPTRTPLIRAALALALLAALALTVCAHTSPLDALGAILHTLGTGLAVGICCAIPDGIKDKWEVSDDFFGDRVYSTTKGSNVGHGYSITQSAAAGTPTYADVDGSVCGEVAVDMDTQAEVQNICLSLGDQLQFDIDTIVEFGVRVKMNQATMNAKTQFAIGLTGDRNDAIDSVAQAALFRVIGADDTTAVVVESDDGTNDNNDQATGATLADSYKWLVISFALGTKDVRFFIDGQPVATATTFDVSNYTGALQFFAQIQKTSDANADGFTVDAWYARGRR